MYSKGVVQMSAATFPSPSRRAQQDPISQARVRRREGSIYVAKTWFLFLVIRVGEDQMEGFAKVEQGDGMEGFRRERIGK